MRIKGVRDIFFCPDLWAMKVIRMSLTRFFCMVLLRSTVKKR